MIHSFIHSFVSVCLHPLKTWLLFWTTTGNLHICGSNEVYENHLENRRVGHFFRRYFCPSSPQTNYPNFAQLNLEDWCWILEGRRFSLYITVHAATRWSISHRRCSDLKWMQLRCKTQRFDNPVSCPQTWTRFWKGAESWTFLRNALEWGCL